MNKKDKFISILLIFNVNLLCASTRVAVIDIILYDSH